MNTLSNIVSQVLSSMKLVREPSNTGTGRYSTWTDEAKRQNEEVVRPFRQSVAKAVKAEFDTLTGKLNIEEKDALVTLLIDLSDHAALKFPELCFGTPARDTKQAKQSAPSVMDYETFKRAIQVVTPKANETTINKAYADYLLNA